MTNDDYWVSLENIRQGVWKETAYDYWGRVCCVDGPKPYPWRDTPFAEARAWLLEDLGLT